MDLAKCRLFVNDNLEDLYMTKISNEKDRTLRENIAGVLAENFWTRKRWISSTEVVLEF